MRNFLFTLSLIAGPSLAGIEAARDLTEAVISKRRVRRFGPSPARATRTPRS